MQHSNLETGLSLVLSNQTEFMSILVVRPASPEYLVANNV